MRIQLEYKKAEDVQVRSVILDLWQQDATGKLKHIYFKQKELRDFLADMPLADLKGVVDFLHSQGKNSVFGRSFDGIRLAGRGEKVSVYTFGLHVPYENEMKGYAFQMICGKKGSLTLYWSIGTDMG